MSALFVTGATGFVGAALLGRIAARGDVSATALVRRTTTSLPASGGIRTVHGDLLDDGEWRAALAGADTVLHLAAATGKLPPAEIRRANVDATENLLEAARTAGVRRFLYVSSIAAKFPDAPHYHYAAAKRDAELAVLASGLDTLIVRPTMVLGRGSPIGQKLRTLAAAPVMPVFGSGRAQIQPIHVDDLAALLLALGCGGSFGGRTLETGGEDVITIEAFLDSVRAAVKGAPGPVLHVPVGPLRAVLGAVERISVKIVPFTAGQLASFTNDGTTSGPDPWQESGIRPAHDIESIIAATAADG